MSLYAIIVGGGNQLSKTRREPASAVELKAEEGKVKDVVMSFRLEEQMHDRLRKLAFDKRLPMRDFIVRGIEQVLKEENY